MTVPRIGVASDPRFAIRAVLQLAKGVLQPLSPHRFPNVRVTSCYRSGRLYRGPSRRQFTARGKEVRAVDIKRLQEWYQLFPEAENLQLDLCGKDACERGCPGCLINL